MSSVEPGPARAAKEDSRPRGIVIGRGLGTQARVQRGPCRLEATRPSTEIEVQGSALPSTTVPATSLFRTDGLSD